MGLKLNGPLMIRNPGFTLLDAEKNKTFLDTVEFNINNLKGSDEDETVLAEFTMWDHVQLKYIRCRLDKIKINHSAQTIHINHIVYPSHQFKAVSFE